MCRHVAYLGPSRSLAELLIDPPHSLYRQAWEPLCQAHGTVNADGFGIGWYRPARPDAPDHDTVPARYRRAVPIWSDPNLGDLATAIHSGAILAAVRDATAGTGLDEAAEAPFQNGHRLFSHNGAIPDWQRLPDEVDTGLSGSMLLELEACTDSAFLWAMINGRLRDGEAPDAALAAVTELIATARPRSRLNMLLTDGRSLTASRWGDCLWYREAKQSVWIASEPSDGGDGWREVGEHHLILADATGVTVRPLPIKTREER